MNAICGWEIKIALIKKPIVYDVHYSFVYFVVLFKSIHNQAFIVMYLLVCVEEVK